MVISLLGLTDGFLLNLLAQVQAIPYLQNRYASALAILVVSGIIAQIMLFLFGLYLKKVAGKTETIIDDLIFEKTKKPVFFLILIYGLKLALLDLGWLGLTSKLVDSLMAVLFLFILLRVFDIIVESWGMTFAKKTKTQIDEVLLPLFHKLGKVIFVIIALMWVMHIWGVDITPYLAGVGISGIVLGLALQDSLKNILGGINLMMDKTYQIGDKVKLESGDVGKIHDIGLRTTKIVTFDNEILYVPNGYLANSRVTNFTHPSLDVRTKVEFTVEYGSDISRVKKVILDTVSKIEGISKKKEPSVQFYEMGDFALKFRVFFWVDDWRDEAARKMEATEAIYNALNKAKIRIPYPTQVVYVKK